MNKKTLIPALLLVILLGVGFIFISQFTASEQSDESMTTDSMNEDTTDSEVTHSSSMSEEEMAQMVAEGQTVMVMGGQVSPTVIYAEPAEEIMIANHEAYDIKLVSEEGLFESEMVASGTDGSFMAPIEVGSYGYYVSENPSLKGTLVVEK